MAHWTDALAREPISQKTLDSLPEYSMSLPSLTTIGKVWKRNLNVFEADQPPLWVICEYVEIGNPDRVGIEERLPVVKSP